MAICRYTGIAHRTQAITRWDVLTWQTYSSSSSSKAGKGEKKYHVLWALCDIPDLCKTQVNEKANMQIPLMESQAAAVICPSSYSTLKKNKTKKTSNWRCHWISLQLLNNIVTFSLTGGKEIMHTVRAIPISRKEAFSKNSFSLEKRKQNLCIRVTKWINQMKEN